MKSLALSDIPEVKGGAGYHPTHPGLVIGFKFMTKPFWVGVKCAWGVVGGDM